MAATVKEPKQMEPKDVTKATFKLRLTGGITIFPKVPSSENAIASTSTCICYHHKAPHENKACYKIYYLVTCWCTVCCILHCSAMHSMETESAERTEQKPTD
mmetsp:Transcript_163276/g.313626  ORF Transcript_163276/g.313626 Transcript_163276/m.313626 type:complete len:102 (+) Transcript_163276:396-701(+)